MELNLTLADRQGLKLRLDFYEQDIILTDFTTTVVSYRVSEKDLRAAYATEQFGMALPPNTVLAGQRGSLNFVSVFVPAAQYLLFVDYGQQNLCPFTIPLPPLLFSLSWRKQAIDALHILALRTNQWPTPDDRLYMAPLPNVSRDTGRVCLGQLKLDPKRLPDDVHAIYQMVMASPFSDHDLSGKSKEFPDNILFAWHAWQERKATEYPPDDLMETKMTVGTFLNCNVRPTG